MKKRFAIGIILMALAVALAPALAFAKGSVINNKTPAKTCKQVYRQANKDANAAYVTAVRQISANYKKERPVALKAARFKRSNALKAALAAREAAKAKAAKTLKTCEKAPLRFPPLQPESKY